MKIIVTGSSGMVGTNIKGIVEQYPGHNLHLFPKWRTQ